MKSTAALGPSALGGGLVTALKLALLPAVLILSVVLGASYGAVATPIPEVIQIILRQIGLPFGHAWSPVLVDIVWNIRLPEVITAVIVGAALALAGAIFQAVLRNPLADPFVIGTSSGALLGYAAALNLGLAFAWLGFGATQIVAFAGAMTAVALVYAIATVGRRTPVLTFLLAGFAVSTLMIAAVWMLAYEGGQETHLLNWMMGSLGDASWNQIAIIGPVIVGLAAVCLFFVRDLNALLLGEDQASSLGVSAERSKLILIGIAALLTALAVSVAGIIGFVGLVIPHISRLIYGANHRLVLVASAFLGAAYLVLSDLAARTLVGAGGELPLGVVTAVIGAPVFLFLLRRSGSDYAF